MLVPTKNWPRDPGYDGRRMYADRPSASCRRMAAPDSVTSPVTDPNGSVWSRSGPGTRALRTARGEETLALHITKDGTKGGLRVSNWKWDKNNKKK